MQRRNEDRNAWWQGAAIVAAALALAAALWHAKTRPFDRDTLGIAVSELQSKAAEGEMLATLDAGHAVPAATRVAHVDQLRRQLDTVRKELRDKAAPAALAQAQARARQLGDALDAGLAHVGRTAFDPATIATFHALAEQAGALKATVDPD